MNGARQRILVIEDDSFLLKMYEAALSREGFEVLSTADGQTGLKLAKEKKPDLILLDLILPRLDGFAVLKRLKKDQATSGIPVLILSNLGQEADIERGLKLGASDYLIKTEHTVKQVGEKIRQTLKKNQG